MAHYRLAGPGGETQGSLPTLALAGACLLLSLGGLMACGSLLEQRPRAAFFFLGLTLLFRLSNVLYAPALLVYAVIYAKEKRLSRSQAMLFLAQCLSLLLVGGLGEVLLYQHLLLGNFLHATYSSIDMESVHSLQELFGNAYYYFVQEYVFALANAVMLVLVYALAAGQPRRWVVLSIAALLLATNYGYYLLHQVHVPYYPYPTVFILWGLALGVCCAAYILSLSLADRVDVGARIRRSVAATATLTELFSPYPVVWAERFTGTVEYTSPANGFRYRWASTELRTAIVRWLYGQGYAQSFCLADIGSGEDVQGFLATALPSARSDLRTGVLGPMLVVTPP